MSDQEIAAVTDVMLGAAQAERQRMLCLNHHSLEYTYSAFAALLEAAAGLVMVWDSVGNPAGDQLRGLLAAHGFKVAEVPDVES